MNVDLKIRHKIINLLEENMGENLVDLRFGQESLGITSKAGSMKKIDMLDLLKMKNIYYVKENEQISHRLG